MKKFLAVLFFLAIAGLASAVSPYVAGTTVSTAGTIHDITGSSAVASSILIVNDDPVITIYVALGEDTLGSVTSADFNLKAGETLSVIKNQDRGAYRYVGLKAASGTPAYRMLATY